MIAALTIIIFVFSPLSGKAQTMWDPTIFGNLQNGSVNIGGDDTSYTMNINSGTSGNASGIQQAMSSALNQSGSWLTVGNVTDYGQGVYVISFSFSRNTTSDVRTWYFEQGLRRFTITQPVGTVPTLSVLRVPEYVFPEEKTTVQLTITNSVSGVYYRVKDSDGNVIKSIPGTGNTIVDSMLLGEGEYTIENIVLNPSFSVQTYEIFRNSPVFADTLVTIPSSSTNPAAVLVAGKNVDGETVFFSSEDEVSAYITPLIQWCNTGDNPLWRQGYELSYSYTATLHSFYLIATAAQANLSEHNIPLVIDLRPYGNDDAQVVTFTHLAAGGIGLDATRNAIVSTMYGDQPSRIVNYYDGLGYDSQTVAVRASGDQLQDLITLHSYDSRFRENRTWLPYAKTQTEGAFDAQESVNQVSFYLGEGFSSADATSAFAINNYESSALDRPRSSYLPGSSYQMSGHGTTIEYVSNSTSDNVLKLSVDPQGTLVVASAPWPSSSLNGVKTTDGDGRINTVFTDAEGRTVREDRFVDANTVASTLYAYDGFGRLAWVIQPEGAASLTSGNSYLKESDFAKKQCFLYEYDPRGRIARKRVPGTGWQEYVYDAADRPVMVRDGNLVSASKWQTMEYDAIGRILRRGLTSALNQSPMTREELQAVFDSGTVPACWTSPAGILQEYAYDEYPSSISSILVFSGVDGVTSENGNSLMDSRTVGLPTWEKVYFLDGNGYAEKTFYYDSKGRVIRTATLYSTGGYNVLSLKYDNGGNILCHHEVSNPNGSLTGSHVLKKDYTYDSMGRMLNCTSKVDSSNEATVEYEYDTLGRLASKCNITTENEEIEETYSYTLQSWEKNRTAVKGTTTLYQSELAYETSVKGSTPSWTGLISSWYWAHSGTQGKVYTYSYDGLARLTGADQYTQLDFVPENKYTERQISYDKNGNLLSMVRTRGSIANAQTISFTYSGSNHRDGYLYDASGNVLREGTEGLWLSYNLLGLPSSVSLPRSPDILVAYSYLADGLKRSALKASNSGYLYDGSFKYTVNGSTFTLESIAYEGGRFESVPGHSIIVPILSGAGNEIQSPPIIGDLPVEDAPFASRIFITDHLGSVRVKVDENGTVIVHNKFLPYGEHLVTSGLNIENNDYLYGGKELQDRFGVNLYDSGARFQANTGAFLSADPMAEKYYGISPYAYCAGNPVNLVDPEGMNYYIFDEDGKYCDRVDIDGLDRIVVRYYENDRVVYHFYDFVDPENDPGAIDRGDITSLRFISDSEIRNMLANQGVFDSKYGKWDFVKNSGHENPNKKPNYDYQYFGKF